jgi:hypothetical protein
MVNTSLSALLLLHSTQQTESGNLRVFQANYSYFLSKSPKAFELAIEKEPYSIVESLRSSQVKQLEESTYFS